MRTRNQLEEIILEEFGVETRLEEPKAEEFGHYTTNAGFLLAKQLGIKPQAAGEKIARVLLRHPDVADASVLKGFVNITLKPTALTESVKELLRDAEQATRLDIGHGQSILYEFVSANPTGPLNVVSARAAAVGDTLVRLANRCGYSAESEFYVNDAGGQIRALGKSIAYHLGLIKEFPEDGYRGEYVREIAQSLNETLAALKHGEQSQDEKTYHEIGQAAAGQFLQHNLEVLKRFGTEFDHVILESEIRKSDYPQKLMALLQGKVRQLDDQALVLLNEEIGDDKDRVIKRSQEKGGDYTYLFWDLAYHLHKAERRYDQLVNLLGPDHHAYAKTITGALKAVGVENLRIKIVQQVHLIRGGARVKMSKRKGEFYTMEQLIDEVGIDAARFFLLSRSTSQPLEFDIDLAKTLSKDNPVYYVQYVHARCCSLMGYAESQSIEPGDPEPDALREAEEHRVMRQLLYLPDTIEAACRNEEPHLLAHYLLKLAGVFHSFYQKHRIITDDPFISSNRLALALAVRAAIKQGLGLLGVSAPEKM